MSKYQFEHAFLTQNLGSILSKLGKEFDSNDFIIAFKNIYPNEYATALKRSDSYHQLHTWVARWYLTELAEQGLIAKGRTRLRKSTNNNTTRNRLWKQ